MAYNYGGCTGGGGLNAYGGGQPAYSAPQQYPSQGLASYGQSCSSETIDYRSLGVSGPSNYGGSAAPGGSYGGAYTGYPQQSYGGGCGGAGGGYGSYGGSYGGGAPAYSAPQQYGGGAPAYSAPQQYGGYGYGQPQQQQQAVNSIDINDPQLNQQVEQIVASLTTTKRPMLRRQVITVPAQCPPRVAYIHRRLPTPPPDIVERITVIKPPRDIVNLCIEKPCQPGPCYQQREICGKPRKPLIQPRVVSVQPRSNPCGTPAPQMSQQNPCCPSVPPYGSSPVGGPAYGGSYGGGANNYGGSYAPSYGGSTTGYPQQSGGGYYGAQSGAYGC